MLPLLSLTLAAALATSSTPPPPDTTQVPEHGPFITLCLRAINPQTDVATIEAIAACQCHFEQMPSNGFVSEAQFNQGMESCKAEGYQRKLEFTRKYVSHFEKEQARLLEENKLGVENGVVLPAAPVPSEQKSN